MYRSCTRCTGVVPDVPVSIVEYIVDLTMFIVLHFLFVLSYYEYELVK